MKLYIYLLHYFLSVFIFRRKKKLKKRARTVFCFVSSRLSRVLLNKNISPINITSIFARSFAIATYFDEISVFCKMQIPIIKCIALNWRRLMHRWSNEFSQTSSRRLFLAARYAAHRQFLRACPRVRLRLTQFSMLLNTALIVPFLFKLYLI